MRLTKFLQRLKYFHYNPHGQTSRAVYYTTVFQMNKSNNRSIHWKSHFAIALIWKYADSIAGNAYEMEKNVFSNIFNGAFELQPIKRPTDAGI